VTAFFVHADAQDGQPESVLAFEGEELIPGQRLAAGHDGRIDTEATDDLPDLTELYGENVRVNRSASCARVVAATAGWVAIATGSYNWPATAGWIPIASSAGVPSSASAVGSDRPATTGDDRAARTASTIGWIGFVSASGDAHGKKKGKKCGDKKLSSFRHGTDRR
jgi:hypothetical protein